MARSSLCISRISRMASSVSRDQAPASTWASTAGPDEKLAASVVGHLLSYGASAHHQALLFASFLSELLLQLSDAFVDGFHGLLLLQFLHGNHSPDSKKPRKNAKLPGVINCPVGGALLRGVLRRMARHPALPETRHSVATPKSTVADLGLRLNETSQAGARGGDRRSRRLGML